MNSMFNRCCTFLMDDVIAVSVFTDVTNSKTTVFATTAHE
jgi:hypothetical protein